ncbi:MAG TPA: amidohydrolase [Pyrinomonadaceae bacterium]|nr:amidohydrolase [Pyrinomonadaceae bacterium]
MKRKLIPFGVFILLASLFASATPQGSQSATAHAGSPATREQQIAQAAEGLRAQLIAQRRDFHMHPELSNHEERTSRVVAERLRALGLEDVKTGVGKYGVTALLRGAKPGPVVAVRADMDALPIQEVNDVPYRSLVPGVKHACGHDVHTTVELGVAEVLSKMRDEIHGTVKFIFQPAEEGVPAGEEGGARFMIKQGAMDNPRPEAIFGLHTNPAIEVGQIAYQSGPAMASSDHIYITIHGRSSHGAQPQAGVDAIVVAAECITAIQNIRSRRIDPQEPLVISIGTIQGGSRNNIIADEVKMEGTMRTLNEEVRGQAQRMMRDTLTSITSAYGATFDLKFDENAAVTYNEPRIVDETLPTLRRVVGAENVVSIKPFMPAEDFSYFQKVSPGFYYFLGVGNKSRGITAGWHTAAFDVDEESLVIGVKVMSNVLLDYLDHHSGSQQ